MGAQTSPSSRHLGTQKVELVREAFAPKWIAPLGPQMDAFEKEFGPILQEGKERRGARRSKSQVEV
jgi:hypothetical protein